MMGGIGGISPGQSEGCLGSDRVGAVDVGFGRVGVGAGLGRGVLASGWLWTGGIGGRRGRGVAGRLVAGCGGVDGGDGGMRRFAAARRADCKPMDDCCVFETGLGTPAFATTPFAVDARENNETCANTYPMVVEGGGWWLGWMVGMRV